jgi:hypothetical protein
MDMTQHFYVTRGDARDFTLTMPGGSELLSAQSVKFTARTGTREDSDVVWEQTLTPTSDTVAVASLGDADWTAWDDASSPRVVHFDFEVTGSDGKPHTVGKGDITVGWDQSR